MLSIFKINSLHIVGRVTGIFTVLWKPFLLKQQQRCITRSLYNVVSWLGPPNKLYNACTDYRDYGHQWLHLLQLAFRSAQQLLQEMRGKVRHVLNMPAPGPLDSEADAVTLEMETHVENYLCQAAARFDLSQCVEVSSRKLSVSFECDPKHYVRNPYVRYHYVHNQYVHNQYFLVDWNYQSLVKMCTKINIE